MKGKRLCCCEISTRPWLSQDNCYQLFQLSHLKPVQPSHGAIIVVVLTEFALLNPHIFLSVHLGVTACSMPVLCYCAVTAWAWPNWDFPCPTTDTSSNERIPLVSTLTASSPVELKQVAEEKERRTAICSCELCFMGLDYIWQAHWKLVSWPAQCLWLIVLNCDQLTACLLFSACDDVYSTLGAEAVTYMSGPFSLENYQEHYLHGDVCRWLNLPCRSVLYFLLRIYILLVTPSWTS